MRRNFDEVIDTDLHGGEREGGEGASADIGEKEEEKGSAGSKRE
jgi:hypothetical protein